MSAEIGLKIEHREVLIGFEKFSFTEDQLKDTESDFQMAQHDLRICQECDGESCMTSINYKCINPFWHQVQKQAKCGPACYESNFQGYYALHKTGCALYDRPAFAIYRCPGAEARKQEILEAMQPDHWWNKES